MWYADHLLPILHLDLHNNEKYRTLEATWSLAKILFSKAAQEENFGGWKPDE